MAFATILHHMDAKSLRAFLRKHPNLSELAKRSGVNVRTLRRIKSGETLTIHHATLVAIRAVQ